jgi:hypothetical protein
MVVLEEIIHLRDTVLIFQAESELLRKGGGWRFTIRYAKGQNAAWSSNTNRRETHHDAAGALRFLG